MDDLSNDRCQLSHFSGLILMALMNDADPIEGIVRHYDAAEDKDAFVLALAGTLLLRHRQWQAAQGKTGE
ncbi:MAG: hypothetical protein HDR50_06725 [Desulfovibrio sp.]|uniref:hypothetical protein n=1 Tax=Desulfovibrio sp. TaxID=885 RepID=UPI001A6922E7|nr:hypothetical protein [Desulfovibrio sp.]MBD5417342.1 hypothetical protein [Desulfovibrio sp.]